MGWWSIGGFPEELMGDHPADQAADALGALCRAREAAGLGPPRYDELLAPIACAIAKAGRANLRVPKHRVIEGVALVMEGARVELRLDAASAPAGEIAPFTALLRQVRTAYMDAVSRRPSLREFLSAISFVARPVPNTRLHPDEARRLHDFEGILRDERGALAEADVLAAVAAAFRRREGKLGALIRGGESITVMGVVAKPREGEPRRVACQGVRADALVVDELTPLLDEIARAHRAEHRELPLPNELAATLLRALSAQGERYAVGALEALSLDIAGQLGAGAAPKAMRVRHAKFGEGTVVRVDEDGERKFEIIFDAGQKKTLLARFVEVISAPG